MKRGCRGLQSFKFERPISQQQQATSSMPWRIQQQDFDTCLSLSSLTSWVEHWFENVLNQESVRFRKSAQQLFSCLKSAGKDPILGLVFSSTPLLSPKSSSRKLHHARIWMLTQFFICNKYSCTHLQVLKTLAGHGRNQTQSKRARV